VPILQANAEKKINRDIKFGLRMNVNNSHTEYDNSYLASSSDINQFNVKRNSFGVYAKTVFFEKWMSNLDFSNANYLYEDLKNGSLSSRYYGEQNLLRWLNNIDLMPDTIATFGVDLNRETFGQSSSYDLIRNTNGYFGGVSYKYQKWDFQGNLRTDDVKVVNSPLLDQLQITPLIRTLRFWGRAIS
jgi:outer membrane cobalamin receptor